MQRCQHGILTHIKVRQCIAAAVQIGQLGILTHIKVRQGITAAVQIGQFREISHTFKVSDSGDSRQREFDLLDCRNFSRSQIIVCILVEICFHIAAEHIIGEMHRIHRQRKCNRTADRTAGSAGIVISHNAGNGRRHDCTVYDLSALQIQDACLCNVIIGELHRFPHHRTGMIRRAGHRGQCLILGQIQTQQLIAAAVERGQSHEVFHTREIRDRGQTGSGQIHFRHSCHFGRTQGTVTVGVVFRAHISTERRIGEMCRIDGNAVRRECNGNSKTVLAVYGIGIACLAVLSGQEEILSVSAQLTACKRTHPLAEDVIIRQAEHHRIRRICSHIGGIKEH